MSRLHRDPWDELARRDRPGDGRYVLVTALATAAIVLSLIAVALVAVR